VQTDRKNLVLISFDDMVTVWHYRTVFGPTLQTPNLDRICASSTAFHRAYCQAPVCSPSRASFMSGLSPHQTGVLSSDPGYFEKIPPQRLWPHRLRSAGYYCSSGGKVMRGYTALPEAVHREIFSDPPKAFRLERRKRVYKKRKVPDRIEMGGYRGGLTTTDAAGDASLYDHQVATSAETFFRDYAGAAPFYREIGFGGTHGPWTSPKRFKEMYDPTTFKWPKPWRTGFDPCPVMDDIAPANIDASHYRFWSKSVRNYFAAVSHVDHHLGRVWDALKASPHAENTLVILVSDHGLHLGERDRFRKHTLWEQVANVPLIIHDPSRPEAKVVKDPVALMDIAPTVADYLALPPRENYIGRSLRPYVETGFTDPERSVPTFLDGNAAIRFGKYRFVRYRDGSEQFFDLEADWWQTKDLGAEHPDYGRVRAAFEETCGEYGAVPAVPRAGTARSS
jgi:arylsulfatase A-like enzyme